MTPPTWPAPGAQAYRNIQSYLIELNARVRVRARLYGDQALVVQADEGGLSPVDIHRLL